MIKIRFPEMKEESHTERSVVTSRGQLVIPAVLRRKLGIEEGTQVVIWESEGRLILQPITGTFVRRLRGSLKENSRVGQGQDAHEQHK
jgi:AbrB family looped-hinge helix DNA binding protein